jgi:hypothetical protein
MLRPVRLVGLTLLLMLLGLTAFTAGCASFTPSGTLAPTDRPTFIFFYTDA